MPNPRLKKKNQTSSVSNDPMFDGIPEYQLKDDLKTKIIRLIKRKKFNPRDFFISGQSHFLNTNFGLQTTEFQIGDYRVNAIRANTQNIDDSSRSTEYANFLSKQDRWEIEVYDKTNKLLLTQAIFLSKSSDINSELYVKIIKILEDYTNV